MTERFQRLEPKACSPASSRLCLQVARSPRKLLTAPEYFGAAAPGFALHIQMVSLPIEAKSHPPGACYTLSGLFCARCLLKVDLIVHSLKDLPTSLPAGLVLGSVGEREVILNPEKSARTCYYTVSCSPLPMLCTLSETLRTASPAPPEAFATSPSPTQSTVHRPSPANLAFPGAVPVTHLSC